MTPAERPPICIEQYGDHAALPAGEPREGTWRRPRSPGLVPAAAAALLGAFWCLPAPAEQVRTAFLETHRVGARFAFELDATPRRILRFDRLPDGRQAAYPLPECFHGSSETGAFAYLDEVQKEPHVAVICGTASDDSALHVFAPLTDPSAPVYTIAGKPGLSVSLGMGGLALSWRGSAKASDGRDGAFWEAPRANFGSSRFREARDRAVGRMFAIEGRLPDGLEGDEYYLARQPDTPLRLGPSPDAPYFLRLADRVLIHAPDPALEDARPVWRVGGWLRVCVVDGGCGYVPEDAVAPGVQRRDVR